MKEFAFQWHITNICNLRCKHCYQEDFNDIDSNSVNDVQQIIKRISNELSYYGIRI